MAASCLYEDLPADELRLSCLRTAPASVSSLLRRVSAFPARSVIQDILWICYASEKGTGFIKISTAMSVQYICKYSYIIRYISLHLQGLSFFFSSSSFSTIEYCKMNPLQLSYMLYCHTLITFLHTFRSAGKQNECLEIGSVSISFPPFSSLLVTT